MQEEGEPGNEAIIYILHAVAIFYAVLMQACTLHHNHSIYLHGPQTTSQLIIHTQYEENFCNRLLNEGERVWGPETTMCVPPCMVNIM